MKKNWGWIIIAITAATPVLLWIVSSPIANRFSDAQSTILSLGQVCALIGAILFSWNFILAARLKLFEDAFGGLNKVFGVHHTIGGIAFIFLLLHPILITAQYLPISVGLTGQMLLDIDNTAKNFGRLTIGIITTVLIITYYTPIMHKKYHWWKHIHQVIGLAIFTGFIHVFLIPSDVANFLPLRYFMLTFLGLGIIAYCYRVLLGKYLVSRKKYIVADIRRFPGRIFEIIMKPVSDKINYHPGQFIFASFDQEGIPTEYQPFSITSDNNNDLLSVGVKSMGDFTDKLEFLKKDTPVKVEGPYGRFYVKRGQKADQVWVAGGIGVTPFLSMMRSNPVIDGGSTWLFYSVNTIDEAVFLPELMKQSKEKTDFSLILHESKKEGFITAELIAKKVGELQDKEIFLCGPTPMMVSLREQLVEMGINDEKIHSEEFAL